MRRVREPGSHSIQPGTWYERIKFRCGHVSGAIGGAMEERGVTVLRA